MAALMVDDPASRDLDDAFTVATSPAGGWTVTIHIAAAALAIPRGSGADQQAQARIESRYRPRPIPMLGKQIERAATLSETQARQALSVTAAFDPTGRCTTTSIGIDTLPAGSCARVAHRQVPDILDDPAHRWHQPLTDAHTLAQILLARRRAAGALAIYDLIHGYTVTEDGAITEIPASHRTVGYIIVAELMIAANTAIANWCIDRDIAILYRNHRASLVSIDGADLAADIAASLHDPEMFAQLQSRTARTLRKATYAPAPRGHHGLRLEAYTHATSPLRRYADLVTQRIICSHIAGEPGLYTAAELDAVAHEINARAQAEKDATAEHFKIQSRKQAAGHILDRDYTALDQKQWRKMFDLMTKVAPFSGIETELNRRLTNNILVPNDLARLAAAGTAWTPIRTRFFPTVRAAHPEYGPSAANGRAQILGTTDRIEIDTVQDPNRPTHQPLFAARARCGTHTGRWQIGESKKAATTDAIWELLDILCGHKSSTDEPPPWTCTDAPPMPPAAQLSPSPYGLPAHAAQYLAKLTPRKRANAFDNPVGWLASFATNHSLGAVDYEYSSTGPPHAPEFNCTATLAGISNTKIGAAKAPARVAAATALLTELFESGGEA